MNHRVNAKVHKLPKCDECGAAAEKPCVTAPGLSVEREPHEIRWRVKRGEVLVISMEEARAIGRITVVRELAAVLAARRTLHAALDAPRKPAKAAEPRARATRRRAA